MYHQEMERSVKVERKGGNYGKGEINVKGVVNIVKSWKKENKGVSCRWEAVQSKIYIYIYLSYEIFESVSSLCVN